MPRILCTTKCDADLFDLSLYIARDNPSAAEALIDTFHEKFQMLAEFPSVGRQRPELGLKVRSQPVGNYVIFYRPIRDGIQVLRVLHGSRNLRRILRRKQ
jgi:toxin ParE1/3/4